MEIEFNKVYNMDCLELMKEMVKQGIVVDWLIADPPYGINAGGVCNMGEVSDTGIKRGNYNKKNWDSERLSKEYFDLMFKVSKNQIIFGGNYYTDYLTPTKSWAIWDKRRDNNHRNSFADCEMAWVSQGQARMFRYVYDGMIQDNMRNKEQRFHPTQKPVDIIIQLLNYYTKEGDTIFDPFMGSFTTAVACHKMGRKFLGAELDKEYFEKGTKRLNDIKSQLTIFDIKEK